MKISKNVIILYYNKLITLEQSIILKIIKYFKVLLQEFKFNK